MLFVGQIPILCPNPGSKNQVLPVIFNVRPPSDVCWFRFAPVTIVISTINIQLNEFLELCAPTERYLGGLTLYVWLFMACSTPDCVDKQISTFATSHTCHG